MRSHAAGKVWLADADADADDDDSIEIGLTGITFVNSVMRWLQLRQM